MKPKRSVHSDPVPVTVPHPAPEVPARLATEAEIPTAAARIVKLAKANGWTADTCYGRGTSIGASGKPTKVVEAVVVYCYRTRPSGDYLTATWIDGKYDGAVSANIFEGRLSSLALKERLAA